MHTIGLVGGIASGKSQVATELSKLGAKVLDADVAAHQAIDLPHVKEALVERWGQKIIGTSGTIDRQAVARIVFAQRDTDRSELRFLESLLHPVIRKDFEEQLTEIYQSKGPAVVIDAPLLLEAGWHDLCDTILFVDAPASDRYERAKRRDWTPEEFARREMAQMPIEEKKALATHLIANDGDLQDLQRATEQFWDVIQRENPPD